MRASDKPSIKYRRAKMRHMLFTTGPNKISQGRLFRKHFDQRINVKHIEISTPRWPKEFDGLRVGHISDFHLGDLMPMDRALAAVQILQNEAPDIVACTGDVVDLNALGAEPLFEAMAKIGAPLGTMLVLGNHDELDCVSTISNMALGAGVSLLRDGRCTINYNGSKLHVAGNDWAKSQKKCSAKVNLVCSDETHILLSHNPKAFYAAAKHNIPLTLSGHTHGGQLAVRDKPDTNLAVVHKHSSGLYARGDSRLFVTVGVGAWFPLRINCPAEVAILTLRSK
jgi:predicted MPP superfamily phosphohydrolase